VRKLPTPRSEDVDEGVVTPAVEAMRRLLCAEEEDEAAGAAEATRTEAMADGELLRR
jgi:hypothetical protein